jgi:hypothetical protein
MSPVKKLLFPFVSLFCIVLVAALTLQNWYNDTAINLGNQAFAPLPLGAVILVTFLLGSGAAFFTLWGLTNQVRAQVKHAELRKEKAEVKAETDSDQIRALESKIDTLEKALEQALSTSTSKKRR